MRNNIWVIKSVSPQERMGREAPWIQRTLLLLPIRFYCNTPHQLQHPAAQCNILQHTLQHTTTPREDFVLLPIWFYYHTLRHAATHGNTRQHTATLPGDFVAAAHLVLLPHTATRGNTLQHTATDWNTPRGLCCGCPSVPLQHAVTRCNTLQHTATHCNTLQHTATHCNTLQHSATLGNTLQHTATLPEDFVWATHLVVRSRSHAPSCRHTLSLSVSLYYTQP